jgi:polyphenol oxidase
MTKVAFSEVLNQGRFETWTTKPDMIFYQVTQVHGTDIVTLENIPSEADGMVVSWQEFNHPLSIKTADCLPIVIEGQNGVVFLHAGWRGLANDILKRPEISLIQPMRAFIGPSIHACCFEVSEDFRMNFPQSPFFIKKDSKLFFDLQQEAKLKLREVFENLLVSIAPVCTCCHHDFHSYRRNKTALRNWNFYIKG